MGRKWISALWLRLCSVCSVRPSERHRHEVLDKWIHEQKLPQLSGQAKLVRFADNFVLLVEKRQDAEGATAAATTSGGTDPLIRLPTMSRPLANPSHHGHIYGKLLPNPALLQ